MMYDFMKFVGLHFGISYAFFKILNYKKITPFIIIITILSNIILSVLQTVTNIPNLFKLIIICFFYAIMFKNITKLTPEKCFIGIILSITISLISSTFSGFVILLSIAKLKLVYYTNPIFTACSSLFSIFLIHILFKIKRIKNGFPFISNQKENTYLSIYILILNAIIIFAYFLIVNSNQISIKDLLLGFILFVLVLLVAIYQTFILYQKQKLQTQTLKDYETELTETKQKLQAAQAEKQTLIKSNHEFYHRQEAIKKKLDDLAKQYSGNYNTEFAAELGNISDRLNKMSDEYISKTNFSPALPKANIDEIDDMLSYMKSECDKNNIEFTLKIDCDINHIINNFIFTSQLETLLGDLIRNSIIAVNHSTNNYRSIMVIFGIKNSIYELCVLDSGIPFEIDTLLNLGLSPASTHLDEGGTGIGFITTFETIKSCNGSITINEMTNNNYSKSIEVQFDNKNEYRIVTQRKESIVEKNINNRDIVLTETL